MEIRNVDDLTAKCGELFDIIREIHAKHDVELWQPT